MEQLEIPDSNPHCTYFCNFTVGDETFVITGNDDPLAAEESIPLCIELVISRVRPDGTFSFHGDETLEGVAHFDSTGTVHFEIAPDPELPDEMEIGCVYKGATDFQRFVRQCASTFYQAKLFPLYHPAPGVQ